MLKSRINICKIFLRFLKLIYYFFYNNISNNKKILSNKIFLIRNKLYLLEGFNKKGTKKIRILYFGDLGENREIYKLNLYYFLRRIFKEKCLLCKSS